jgi:predicted DsbA family dithiol-disulfide isomerase
MAFKVTMFSDFICPFCYIGFETIRKIKPELDLEIEWRGFEIHPEFPASGIPAEKIYGAVNSEARKAAWGRISAMAQAAGIEMSPPRVLTNSHQALAVCEYAREVGRSEEFEERVYRAYFREGENIGDLEVLKKLGAEAGLDPGEVEQAAHSPKYELKLKNNTLAAHSRGVNGVPTFFVGEFPLVGAQSEDVMRQILGRAIERLGNTAK